MHTLNPDLDHLRAAPGFWYACTPYEGFHGTLDEAYLPGNVRSEA